MTSLAAMMFVKPLSYQQRVLRVLLGVFTILLLLPLIIMGSRTTEDDTILGIWSKGYFALMAVLVVVVSGVG